LRLCPIPNLYRDFRG